MNEGPGMEISVPGPLCVRDLGQGRGRSHTVGPRPATARGYSVREAFSFWRAATTSFATEAGTGS